MITSNPSIEETFRYSNRRVTIHTWRHIEKRACTEKFGTGVLNVKGMVTTSQNNDYEIHYNRNQEGIELGPEERVYYDQSMV